ncbi:MAG: VPLPA-CTERM sorting domain-containing protein [Candidatus Thiodiazotropha sp.]
MKIYILSIFILLKRKLSNHVGSVFVLLMILSSPVVGAPVTVVLDFDEFDFGDRFILTYMSDVLPYNPGNYLIFSEDTYSSFIPGEGLSSIEVTSGGIFSSPRSICSRQDTFFGPGRDCTGGLSLLFGWGGANDIRFDVGADDSTDPVDVAILLEEGPYSSGYSTFSMDGAPLTPHTIMLETLLFNERRDGSGASFSVDSSTKISGLSIRSAIDPAGLLYDNIVFTFTPIPLPPAVWLFITGIIGLMGFNRRRGERSF